MMGNKNVLINEIKDIYDALAIVLVFTTILASNSEKRASSFIDEYIKTGKKIELTKQYEGVNKFIYKEWIFIILVNIGLLYILTPTAWEIIVNTKIDFINFDVSMTLFMFIYIIMGYFIVSYIILTSKIIKHRKLIKEELKKLQ